MTFFLNIRKNKKNKNKLWKKQKKIKIKKENDQNPDKRRICFL